MSRTLGAVAALSAVALTAVACTSSSDDGAERTDAAATSTPASALPRTSSSTTTALVPAAANGFVQVVPLTAEFRARSGFEVPTDALPVPMRLDRPNRVRFLYYNGDARKATLGLTVIATNGKLDCGAAFAAPPGHGYRVTCSFTPTAAKGEIGLSYADPATGAAKGTKATAPFTAR